MYRLICFMSDVLRNKESLREREREKEYSEYVITESVCVQRWFISV